MEMSKRDAHSGEARRVDARKVISVAASILLPPLGAYLVWNTRWKRKEKYLLSALAAVCFALIAGAMFWPDGSGEGGIEYVPRKPEVKVYGPELPEANISGYIAPVSQSVLATDDDENTTYVYAITSGEYYHLSSCKYFYESSQKMTPYEGYFLGYGVCPLCNPPAYVPGTVN